MPEFDIKIIIKRLSININIFTIPFYIIAILSSFTIQYFATVAFIIAHELGHIMAALISGGKIYRFRILPVGVNASIDDYCCQKSRKLLIYFAGPCVNIIFAILIYILYANHVINIELTAGAYINIWLAFFNLLPILPLDGGKIVLEALSDYSGLYKASKYINKISVLLSIFIIIVGLIAFKQNKYNVCLIFIGIYVLLLRTESKREAALSNIKNLLFRRSRIIKQRIYPIRQIAVMKDVKLSEVIKAMDYANMFHLVNVLDDNLKVLKVVSEQEILDALIKNNVDTEIGNILNLQKK